MNGIVVVSRRWHQPAIQVQHLEDGIAINMAARDFAQAFAQSFHEASPPLWKRMLNRKSDVEAVALKVLAEVVNEMKQATIHSPPPLPATGK